MSDATLKPANPSPERTPRYELIFNGNRRAYADTFAGLMDALAPGYESANEADRWFLRLDAATTAQVTMQAYFNNTGDLAACSPAAQLILTGSRNEQPSVPSWAEPIPLILVASSYTHEQGIPAPAATADGTPPNVLWVDPSDTESLLRSLHHIGYVTVCTSENDDAVP